MHKLTQIVHDNVGAILAGVTSSAAFAAIASWRMDEGPWYAAFPIFLAATAPILVVGWKVLWFDREAYDRQFAQNEDNIENAWAKDAAEMGFWTIISGSLLLWGVGMALKLDWMSSIGLVHVLALGAAGFLGSYFVQMRKQR